MNSLQSTGALLVAAFVVFLAGAGFWLVQEFERPLDEMLAAVNRRRRRWLWIHSWMVAGTLVGVVAVASLSRLLGNGSGDVLATAGFGVFSLGCAVFLLEVAFRLTATLPAAAEAVRTGSVPPGYESRHRLAGKLHTTYMLLSYAAFVALGGAILGGSLLPAWLGWFGIASGLAGFVGYLAMRGGPFAPPIIAHSFGLLVGIVLLVVS